MSGEKLKDLRGLSSGDSIAAAPNEKLRQKNIGRENSATTLHSDAMKKHSADRVRHTERRPRKKRRTFSCGVCRKFKTRCDFEPLIGKCHRCNVLRLDCSLTKEREEEIVAALEESSKSALETPTAPLNGQTSLPSSIVKKGTNDIEPSAISNSLTKTLSKRLNSLEEGFKNFNGKLELILFLLQGSSSATTGSSDLLASSNYTQSSKVDDYVVDSDEPNSESSSATSEVKTAISDNDLVPVQPGDTPEPISVSTSKYSRRKPLFNGSNFKDPPLKLIRDIDERLFPREATSAQDKMAKQQRPFVVARINFLRFYDHNKELCLNLSREFLVRSHFWIVPGGIKEIDDQYARRHVFITSVFTIVAMSFDDNDKYAEEQELLYPIVERLLTNTLTMFEKLIAHDIEAILYCCMFHISRKAKRHRQLQLNSLVLSDFAINSLLSIFDFNKIKERVLNHEEHDSVDLYHLRILNCLTACKLEYAIGYGNFSPLDDSIKELNNLTAKFPQSNFGDDIKVSEINLGDIVNLIFINFEAFFKGVKCNFVERIPQDLDQETTTKDILVFPELSYWIKNWEELLAKDGGGVLLFTFDFYHIMICRTLISDFLEEIKGCPRLLKCTLNTMKEYSFSLLRGFLRLPPSLIKGAPMLTTHQLVYACLTLCDFLHWFDPSERQMVLNVCTRVYWHLNAIGEKMNEATDNVGKIIKSIIDTSKNRVGMSQFTLPGSSVALGKSNSYAELNIEPWNMSNSPQSTHSNISGSESTAAGNFILPDVNQFDSFEDFFQDFFDNLKPTTQRMFSTTKSQMQFSS